MRFLLFIFFYFLISKEVIFLNEELLFILSFLLFFYFAFTLLGTTAKTFLDQRSQDFLFRSRSLLFLRLNALKKQKAIYEKGLLFDSFFVDLFSWTVKSGILSLYNIEKRLLPVFRFHVMSCLRNIVKVEFIVKEKISNRIRGRLFLKLRRVRRKMRRVFSLALIAGNRNDALPFSFIFRLYAFMRFKHFS